MRCDPINVNLVAGRDKSRSPFRQKGPTSAQGFQRLGAMRVLEMLVDGRWLGGLTPGRSPVVVSLASKFQTVSGNSRLRV